VYHRLAFFTFQDPSVLCTRVIVYCPSAVPGWAS